MVFKTKAEKKAFRAGCSTGYRNAKKNNQNKQSKTFKKAKENFCFLPSEGNRPLTMSQRHNILMRDSGYRSLFQILAREGDYSYGSQEHLNKTFESYSKIKKGGKKK